MILKILADDGRKKTSYWIIYVTFAAVKMARPAKPSEQEEKVNKF
jgi:hypothetical protein